MNPPSVKYLVGDVREVLKKIPEESVHLVITSPPYWGLRIYKDNPPVVWDEVQECTHEWGDEIKIDRIASDNAGLDGSDTTHNACAHVYKDAERRGSSGGWFCKRCNAWKGCLGNEPTPYLYIKHIVDVAGEIRRILRKDGTFCLNLGDSYANSGTGGHGETGGRDKSTLRSQPPPIGICPTKRMIPEGLKNKDMIMVPQRTAIALQADGWWVRSIIPWVKRNPMPNSVTDRPGSAVEYIIMLTKSDDYYYDYIGVRLKGKIPAGTRAAKGSQERSDQFNVNARPPEYKVYSGMRNRRDSDWFFDSLKHVINGGQILLENEVGDPLALVVNPRPYPEAKGHFAVFPTKLVEPFIIGGTSEKGCCQHCGAPWIRVIEKDRIEPTTEEYKGKMSDTDPQFSGRRVLFNMKSRRDAGLPHDNPVPDVRTVGWEPTCSCKKNDPTPCTVLDPFVGSGTTMVVAYHLGRHSIGIDISGSYAEMTLRRFKKRGGYQHKTEEFA